MFEKALTTDSITNRIYTLRRVQVMLDEDLAMMYGVETKVLNQAVKRNQGRFPEEFCFHLEDAELEILKSQLAVSSGSPLRSQPVTLKSGRGQHRKYRPYAFTEQGIAMLSAVLRSDTAVKVSVHIMNAFVTMRRFLQTNAQLFQLLDTLEVKQIETDQKINTVLTAIENKSILPKQGIFYDGQIFDAWQFVSDLVRSAQKSIVLIDNYVDDSVLGLFAKRQNDVAVLVLTKNISKQLDVDFRKFNDQYEPIVLKEFTVSHDRFLLVDGTELYHFRASLKDMGKKWFAFSKMDMQELEMLENLKKIQIT